MSRPKSIRPIGHHPIMLGVAVLVGADALITTTLSSAVAPSSWMGPLAGLVFAAQFAGLALALLRADRFVAARGPGAALAVAVAALLASALLLPLLPSVLVWMVLRFVAGAAVGVVAHVGAAWLDEAASAGDRPLAFVVTTQLGAAAIQPVLAVYGPGHVETFVLAGALMAVGAGLLAGGERSVGPQPVLGAWTRPGLLGIVAPLGAGAALGSLLVFGPAWAYGLGLDVASTGIFMALLLIGGLGQLLLGRFVTRWDPRITLAVVAWALAIVAVGYVFSAARSFLLAAPLALLSGALAFSLLPMVLALTRATAGAAARPSLERSTLTLAALGGAAGALLTSVLMSPGVLGPAGLAVGVGLAAVGVAAASIGQRLRSGRAAPLEGHDWRTETLPMASPGAMVLRADVPPGPFDPTLATATVPDGPAVPPPPPPPPPPPE